MGLMKEFWDNEDGIGVVEIVLILVILIALIVIFKDKISTIISNAFSQIDDGAGTINDEITMWREWYGGWEYYCFHDIYFPAVVHPYRGGAG